MAMPPTKTPQFAQPANSASSVETSRDPQTYAIIGAAMEVHRVLGCGFLEPVYQQALAKELLLRGIPFRREVELPITYKGDLLLVTYKADFICYDAVIVELKALDRLSGREKAQVINYLKASEIERGLLLNFGTVRLEYERVILTARASSADCPREQPREGAERGPEQFSIHSVYLRHLRNLWIVGLSEHVQAAYSSGEPGDLSWRHRHSSVLLFSS